MDLAEIESIIFAHKPVFGRILKERGAESLLDYYRSRRHQPSRLPAGRQAEFLDTVTEMTTRLLGSEVAASLRAQLERNYVASTAGHHDTVNHPFFSNSVLVDAYANGKDGGNNVIVLSCGGISLNNSSFPRGFLMHDNQGRDERLLLISLKNHHHPVYGRAGFTAASLEGVYGQLVKSSFTSKQRVKLRLLIEATYGTPEILSLPYFSDQLTKGIYNFYKKVPSLATANVIHLEQETLVAELLTKHHLKAETVVSAVLFDTKTREAFVKHFDGITGSHNSKKNKGTQLFWALNEKNRISLTIKDDALTSAEHKLKIPLTPAAITKALAAKQLMPSMALSYIVLAFYYGLACEGGFSQVNYLTDMKAAYHKLLAENKKFATEQAHLPEIPTDFYSGDFVLALLGVSGILAPATPLDLILYENKSTDATLRKLARTLTLRQATLPMFPELYKIITGTKTSLSVPHTHEPSVTLSAKCYYCGNNPTPHAISLINEYIALINQPLERLGTSWLGRLVGRGLDMLGVPLAKLGAAVKLVHYNNDIKKVPNSRSGAIWEEAQRRGIPMRQLCIFGKSTDVYEAKPNGRTIVFESIPIPGELITQSLQWMDDKLQLKKRLLKAGIPAARGGAFSRFEPMAELFEKIDKPVIVKPAQGSRGRHTTTFIYTKEQLKQAFDIGKQIARRLVMEEHLVGSVYRGTVIRGKLLGVERGDPPRITGDSKSTIRELIVIKNTNRHLKVKEFKIVPMTERFLARSNYTLDTILPTGTTIDLTEKIGDGYGGFSAEVFPSVHPEVKKVIEAAARAVDFPVIGFDFIVQDITKSPVGQKWGILEANSLPFIDLHQHAAEGVPINIASHVWDFWK